jgi:hypothetical protein
MAERTRRAHLPLWAPSEFSGCARPKSGHSGSCRCTNNDGCGGCSSGLPKLKRAARGLELLVGRIVRA